MWYISVLGTCVWCLIVLVSLLVCWVGTLPGNRRVRQDPKYAGPERRADDTRTDFLSQPMISIRPKLASPPVCPGPNCPLYGPGCESICDTEKKDA